MSSNGTENTKTGIPTRAIAQEYTSVSEPKPLERLRPKARNPLKFKLHFVFRRNEENLYTCEVLSKGGVVCIFRPTEQLYNLKDTVRTFLEKIGGCRYDIKDFTNKRRGRGGGVDRSVLEKQYQEFRESIGLTATETPIEPPAPIYHKTL